MSCGCRGGVQYALGSGGGVSSANPFDWVECATLAEIQAEIADGAQILVTADINLGAAEQIELVAGTVAIGRKAGVTIAGGSGEPIFLVDGNIAARLILVDPHPVVDELGNSTAFLASHASVGPLCEITSGSALAIEAQRLTLNLAAGGSLAGDGQRLGLDIGSLVAKCPDGSAVFASEFGAIRHIETLGGGASASVALNTDVHGGRISGELRSSGSGAGITVAPGTGRSRVTCGPLNGAYAESTGVLIHIFDATLIECPGAKLYAYGNGPQVLGGKTAELFLGGLSVGGKAASFVGLEATRLTELGTTYRASFQGCRWAPNGVDTITSYGEGSTWDGGEFYAGGGSIIFATGSQWAISGAVGGLAITLSSGAQMRVRDSELAGITNSDPLSIITGSRGDALALDTTPHTARYASSVLDPLIGRLVFSYPGTTEGESSRAPHQRASGVIGIETSPGASMNSGYYVSSTTGRFRARINWGAPSRLGWALSFFWRPTSVSFGGAEQNVMTISDAIGNFIAINQIDNNIRVYVQGVGFYATSTAGNLFSTSTARLVVVSVRVNAGSVTLYVRVNGTQVIAAAGAPLLPYALTDLILGANGADARAGRFTKIEAWDIGLTNTQMDELLAKSLLSGMAA